MTEATRMTLAGTAHFEGRGLHSGIPVQLAVKPGDSGIAFWSGRTRIPATAENVTDTSRCTVLGEVATIEHLMSALSGLGFTDAEIEVEGPELPALDGSAALFAEGLIAAGRTEIGKLEIEGPFARVYHVDGDVKIAIARGEGHWRYDYETGDRWPHSQSVEWSGSPSEYRQQISPARTFAHESEIAMIREAGLAKGLDETSALVIGDKGYVNQERFSDEPARHKLLDLIGDLALAGVPASALGVVGTRSGHRTNVAAAVKLAQHVRIRSV